MFYNIKKGQKSSPLLRKTVGMINFTTYIKRMMNYGTDRTISEIRGF